MYIKLISIIRPQTCAQKSLEQKVHMSKDKKSTNLLHLDLNWSYTVWGGWVSLYCYEYRCFKLLSVHNYTCKHVRGNTHKNNATSNHFGDGDEGSISDYTTTQAMHYTLTFN